MLFASSIACGQNSSSTTPTSDAAPSSAADASDASSSALVAAVHRIGCGYDFTCAIVGDGRVKCWGQNNRGQLGIGTSDVHGLYGQGMGNQLPFVNLGANTKAASLAVGREHACALLTDGHVKCWGANDYGQLGLGVPATRVGHRRVRSLLLPVT
jgi:alpha-tubulin suppressor-like RCC1 family protein